MSNESARERLQMQGGHGKVICSKCRAVIVPCKCTKCRLADQVAVYYDVCDACSVGSEVQHAYRIVKEDTYIIAPETVNFVEAFGVSSSDI